MTTAQENMVAQYVANGMHHRTAIRFVLTGATGIRMYNKATMAKLVEAVKDYERKHKIVDGHRQ